MATHIKTGGAFKPIIKDALASGKWELTDGKGKHQHKLKHLETGYTLPISGSPSDKHGHLAFKTAINQIERGICPWKKAGCPIG